MTPPEWLIERGIGEMRMALVEEGEIVEARVLLDGAVAAGTLLRARLKQAAGPAVAEAGGLEYLLPKGAAGLAEGAALTIEVTREAIPGGEPWKRPLARVADGESGAGALPKGEAVQFPSPDDRLAAAGWLDLAEEAASRIIRFEGGELRVSPTPAMTLIDVDGTLPPLELAKAGAGAAARAIRRHGVGGSIGIDFPTIAGKGGRQGIGEIIDSILPQPFERTAMNGFGFLQIVRPRRHASLFEMAQDRAAFEARALLRRAARETGAIRLIANPAVINALQGHPDWLGELGRQVGGAATLRSDPALSISGGHVEKA